MAIQQRAERTRQEILSAAARVFDGLGYERASLARIAGTARVTTGALVFHFATKADLATAVRGRARAVTRTAVESACLSTEGVGGTSIDKLVLTTHALIRLFETDHAARAGERLARELGGTGHAPSGECPWRREVARLARYAAAEQALRPGVDATAVAALIGYVITGVELEMRSPNTAADDETWPAGRDRRHPRPGRGTPPPHLGVDPAGSRPPGGPAPPGHGGGRQVHRHDHVPGTRSGHHRDARRAFGSGARHLARGAVARHTARPPHRQFPLPERSSWRAKAVSERPMRSVDRPSSCRWNCKSSGASGLSAMSIIGSGSSTP